MIKVIAQFQTTLTAGISAAATTGKLESNASADYDAATLPDGDYGIVIDERNSRREYAIISLVGFDFTFVKRGLSMLDGDTVKTGNQYAHRKGAQVKIVSHPIIAKLVRAFNGEEAFAGVILLPSDRVISTNRQVVDKEYADSIIASGISSLAVSQNGSALEVNINSGYYSLNGVITYYAGASAQALVDDATNYIELTDGALAINQTGFDNDSMPLGKAICASGVLTSLTDARAVLGWLDIKPSLGIGRDSSGIFIDLATDPGVEFSSGKLRVKIKANGGVVRDSNGLSVDAGTTANKVVVLDANARIPAVDGGLLTGIVPTRGTGASNGEDGTITIAHGLGRTPRMVKLYARASTGTNAPRPDSVGSYDGSTYACIFTYAYLDGSTYYAGDVATNKIGIVKDYLGGNKETAITVTTLDATNIVLTNTKTTAACPYDYLWEAC
mgnify:CR=1 FL=1